MCHVCIAKVKPGSFQEKLAYLDSALTQARWIDVCHTVIGQERSPEDFAYAGEYYLSDGGYSRICWNRFGEGRLFLTSNSTAKAKDNWKNCKELIADIEREILCGLQ